MKKATLKDATISGAVALHHPIVCRSYRHRRRRINPRSRYPDRSSRGSQPRGKGLRHPGPQDPGATTGIQHFPPAGQTRTCCFILSRSPSEKPRQLPGRYRDLPPVLRPLSKTARGKRGDDSGTARKDPGSPPGTLLPGDERREILAGVQEDTGGLTAPFGTDPAFRVPPDRRLASPISEYSGGAGRHPRRMCGLLDGRADPSGDRQADSRNSGGGLPRTTHGDVGITLWIVWQRDGCSPFRTMRKNHPRILRASSSFEIFK